MKKSVIIKEGLLVLVTIIWGLGFIAQSIGGSYLDAYTFNLCRNVVATITLVLVVVIKFLIDKKKSRINKDTSIITCFKNKNLIIGGVLAGISLAIAMTFQQIGVTMCGAGKSGFLTALYIIFVPVIGLFMGKKMNFFLALSIILSITGLYFINVTDGKFELSSGSIFLILCALGYSGQILAIDKFGKGVDSIHLSFIQFFVAAICMVPFALIFGNFDLTLIGKAMPAILFLGVISSCIAYTLQVYAQTEVNVTVACIIMSLESVFSFIFGCITLHETHGILEIGGCILIFSAVILAQINPPKSKKSKLNEEEKLKEKEEQKIS